MGLGAIPIDFFSKPGFLSHSNMAVKDDFVLKDPGAGRAFPDRRRHSTHHHVCVARKYITPKMEITTLSVNMT